MGRHSHPAGCLPLRMARLFACPNELRRSSDRIEAAVVAGLVAVFAAAAVIAALLAARVYRSDQAGAPTGLRLASAVLSAPGAVSDGSFLHQATARATWRLSDGASRSGTLTSELAPGLYGQAAGASVWVWLDRSGAPEPPPPGPFGMITSATLAGAAVIAGAVAALACGYRLCRRGLDRRRLARWSSAWAVTGPQWTSLQ